MDLVYFVKRRKYNIRYDIFWRFVPDLLRIEAPLLLDAFFELIDGEPRDLLGPTHQRLMIHCLAEIRNRDQLGKKFQDRIKRLEGDYWQWIKLEFKLDTSQKLASETECPKRIFASWLQGSDRE